MAISTRIDNQIVIYPKNEILHIHFSHLFRRNILFIHIFSQLCCLFLCNSCKSVNHSLCPTLLDLSDCSLQGSSVLEILQVKIPEWVAISYLRGFSKLRDQTWVSCIADSFFPIWATREDLVVVTETYSLHIRTTN